MSRSLHVRLAVILAAILPLTAAPSAAGTSLTGFKAAYDLSLAPGAQLTGLASITGRTVTEFRGSACAGYMTSFRFVTRTTSDEGKVLVDDVRVTSFETPDGYYEFDNEIYSGDALARRTTGTAERDEHATTVTMTAPSERTFDIAADVVFPAEQVVRVLDAALAGERFIAFPLYDGTEDGETVYDTSTVIGAGSTATDDLGAETAIADAGFAGLRHWPVTISYFKGDSRSDMLPVYTMSLILYENGISRALRLDYGAYTLIGTLSHLDVLPAGSCPE